MPPGVKSKTEEERRDEVLFKKFGSRIELSVKVKRPTEKYPFEREVWSSEISVPVTDSRDHIEAVVEAWVKTMEAGIELAVAFRTVDTELEN